MLGRIADGAKRLFASPRPQLENLDYDDYWARRDADVFQPRFKLIADLLRPGCRVIDLGCGDGSLLRYLHRAKGISGWGVDISSRAVATARSLGTKSEVADITDPSFRLPSDFDSVVISEVLEHIADPERLLVNLHASGANDLIVTLPNTGFVEHRLRLMLGRFPVQWLFHPGEHLRFWTVADFAVTASATGYTVVSVRGALGWFPFARAFPSLFASQIVFHLKPALAPSSTER
jgi:methionine biosynthesis protein MetW